MIEYIEGNIFNSPAQVIVNTVNTVGIMGKGLALSFKKRYPKMYEAYRTVCDKRQFSIGKLMLYYAPDHWVLLFPTKENWRSPSSIEYLEEGLKKFVCMYADKGITSIAFPKLGCGNGELAWNDVRPVMEKYLKPLPIVIYIYIGFDSSRKPEHMAQEETMEWLRINARDFSFTGLRDDLRYGAALLPYQLDCNGLRYSVAWQDGLAFIDEKGECKRIIEDELFNLWDEIRTQGIIAIDTSRDSYRPLYSLLNDKGYLSPVIIHDERSHCKIDGYQVNEGYGRVYALRR